MKKRKSFLVHIDSLAVLDELTDEQCGELFRAIKAHHYDDAIELSSIAKIAFAPFKSQFQRDDEKYQKTCKARAEAGSKGGKQKVANQAIASKSKQDVANLADSDNKNDSDSDKKEICRFAEFWDLYGKNIDLKKCRQKWNRLKKTDIEKIFETLPRYIESTPDKQFRKSPSTYLNNESWNDEIAIASPVTSESPYSPGDYF